MVYHRVDPGEKEESERPDVSQVVEASQGTGQQDKEREQPSLTPSPTPTPPLNGPASRLLGLNPAINSSSILPAHAGSGRSPSVPGLVTTNGAIVRVMSGGKDDIKDEDMTKFGDVV